MRGHGPRTASRWGGLVATAMVVVGCTLPSVDDGGATEGEGWSLAADLDAAPAQPPEQLRIAPSEARLAEVWDDWGLPDVPPAIDFDTSWAAVVTGLAACAGELEDVEVEEAVVAIRVDDEALACQPGDGQRTMVLALDREVTGEGAVSVLPVADGPATIEPTDTPPALSASEGALDAAAVELEVTAGEQAVLEVAVDAAIELDGSTFRPEDVTVRQWDGVQWRSFERPAGTEVVIVDDRALEVRVPTDELASAPYAITLHDPRQRGRAHATVTVRSG